MTTTPTDLDNLDHLLEEYASAHVEYWTSEDDSPFEADAKKRREGAAAAIREQFASVEDELAKTRAELKRAQRLEAMAGRHAQARDADLNDAEVTIARLKARLAEGDARWSRHMADEHPIQSDRDCPARAEKGYFCTLDPGHDGDHVAMALPKDGGEEYEATRWPQEANPATTAEPAAWSCVCPPYRYAADGSVEALPQGTNPDCRYCHPAAEPKATVPPAYNLPPKHCGNLRVHAPHVDSGTFCDGRTLPDAEPAAS